MKQLFAMAVALLLVASSAHAEDRNRARTSFRLGSQHYALGEYKEALTAFKEAYRNYEDPSFLFNIAQCERQLDQRADAIRAYRMYLVNAPDAGNRDEVRQLISRLERELAAERAKAEPPKVAQTPPAPAPHINDAAPTPAPSLLVTAKPSPPRDKPAYKKWWVWTLVGVTVAGGAAAGVAIALTRGGGGTTPTATTSFGTASPF